MQVQKCGKATTSNHTWNEGCHFAIEGDLNALSFQVALIAKGMMSSKAVGFVKCPLRDILVFHLAREKGAIKTAEIALDLSDGNPNVKCAFFWCFSPCVVESVRVTSESEGNILTAEACTHRVWQRGAQG